MPSGISPRSVTTVRTQEPSSATACTARSRRLSTKSSAMRTGHQRGEVFGPDVRRWRRRAPVVETAGSLHRFRLPQLLIDYLVEIGVVLGEVACRIP